MLICVFKNAAIIGISFSRGIAIRTSGDKGTSYKARNFKTKLVNCTLSRIDSDFTLDQGIGFDDSRCAALALQWFPPTSGTMIRNSCAYAAETLMVALTGSVDSTASDIQTALRVGRRRKKELTRRGQLSRRRPA